MNTASPFLIPLMLGVFLVAAWLTAVVTRVARARARARRRVVELPNSHYTAELVRENETRHRWHEIPLDGMHEINRQEVQRLLRTLEATSIQTLRPNDRLFLDRMAEIARGGASTAS